MKNKNTKNTKKLITAAQNNDIFSSFESDKKRISYISENYKDMSIGEAFANYYSTAKPKTVESAYDTVTIMEPGQVYLGNIKDIEKGNITFEIPGVNEEIVCIENLNSHLDALRNYALNHNNTMYFEVREIKGDKVLVSVLNGYYKIWEHRILNGAKNRTPVKVHVNNLVKGGYSCSTKIDEINDLLGVDTYVCNVFIPGSHIILNIENDFERWLDQDVYIIPDKFVDFRVDKFNKQIEKSLIGSRKKYLQYKGEQNIYDLYQKYQLAEKLGGSGEEIKLEGKVTGIINSTNKTGVFVELEDKYITGLMPVANATELVNYIPGSNIIVKIKEFETPEGVSPFITNKEGSILYKCNTRLVFEVA